MQSIKKILRAIKNFFGSDIAYRHYWQKRYTSGGNSGAGSYNELSYFKAEIVNRFIQEKNVQSVIEFGCGDGNQLKLMKYTQYLGLDVAPASVVLCSTEFKDDATKSFMQYNPKSFFNRTYIMADAVVCLDVLYHIIPEEDFLKTLHDIFSCARKYVILYTSIDAFKIEPYVKGAHVRHRDTLLYLKGIKDFEVIETIPQRYPTMSSAHFIILQKKSALI